MSGTAAVIGRPRPVSRLKWAGIILLGIVVVLALAAWAASILLRPRLPSPASLTRAMRDQAALTGGEKVYVTYCAYCHDKGFGPSLAGLGLPVLAVNAIVRSGPAMMPAFSPAQLSDADVAAVTQYISTLPARQDRPK